MKKFLLAVIGICLCLGGCSSSNQVFTGYDSTYWGMSKEEVLELISYVEYYNETETEVSFKDARVLNMRDFNAVSLRTFDPFGGGYQIPEVTYKFENNILNEIEVKYTYEAQQDTEWYNVMVDWLDISYEKDYVSPLEDQDDIMRYGATSFIIDEYGTEIMLITMEMKSVLDDYGTLYISYKPNEK